MRRRDAAGVAQIYPGSPVVFNGKPTVGLLQLAVPAARVDALILQLDNALKFTPGGGQVVWEIAARQDGVLNVIRDTRQGIPAADLPHIFERSYRGDKTHSREAAGTGLGLALVQSIVRAYGRRIEVASSGPGGPVPVDRPGGTRVSVWWPRLAPAAPPLPPVQQAGGCLSRRPVADKSLSRTEGQQDYQAGGVPG